MIKIILKLVKTSILVLGVLIVAFLIACRPSNDCKVFILDKNSYSLSRDTSIEVYLGCPLSNFEYDFIAIYQDLNQGPMTLQTIQDKDNDRLIAKFSSEELKNFGFVPGEASIFIYRRIFNPETRDYSPELSSVFRVEITD